MADELALRRAIKPILDAADELKEAARGLRESVNTRREPTATVELTEDELSYLVGLTDPTPGKVVPLNDSPAAVAHAVWMKLDQALLVESGPGGNFYGGDAA
jgi:hypothetical protein